VDEKNGKRIQYEFTAIFKLE